MDVKPSNPITKDVSSKPVRNASEVFKKEETVNKKPSTESTEVKETSSTEVKEDSLDKFSEPSHIALKKKNKALKKKIKKFKKLKKATPSPEQKHLNNWQSSRSAVAVMQSTKDYHVHLTTLSDQKANIVIAAASIIISVCLSQIQSYSGAIGLALLILVGFTAVALMFAILSVSPIVSKKAKKMELDNPGFNPFFFGHYTDVQLPEFTDHMVGILKDQDTMYSEMIKDLYQMGMVLKKRKFKYLTYSYRIFFVGILISFVICIIGGFL